jgi:hypothetical protein
LGWLERLGPLGLIQAELEERKGALDTNFWVAEIEIDSRNFQIQTKA